MIGIGSIRDAARRLHGVAVRTPLIEHPAVNAVTGGRVFLKIETLQRTGSFKFRGAYARLSQIPLADRRKGAVGWSSGNHAQGVAAAAKLLDMPAAIVMPDDAPKIKIERTRALGAEIVFYDRRHGDREAIGRALCLERNATLVPSYDDYGVMAGQGTIGLEIAEDMATLGIRPDAVLAPCSGGGLISGLSVAVHDTYPLASIHAVEPERHDDLARSLAAGKAMKSAPPEEMSICDALLAPAPGDLTFPIMRSHLAGALAVSDDEVRAAMRFAYEELKLVLEPGGAAALAALLSARLDAAGKTAVCVLSGGNADPELFASVIR